jgi:hypothetical protein
MTKPSAKTIAQLQAKLLKAALLRQPLPGSSQPVQLSDLQFIFRHPKIYLLDENLAGKISVEGLPKPLEVIKKEGLQKLAEKEGDVAYLRFQPPEVGDDTVRLTLEGKLATKDASQNPMGLSSVQVRFRKDDKEWLSTEGPIAFAS